MADDIGTDTETGNVVAFKGATSGDRRTGKAESGLTLKQEAFAQAIANGETNADSYRASYDASGMAANTIYSKASLLASDEKIRARVTALLAERRAKKQHVSAQAEERLADRVWRNTWKLAETAESESVRVNAIALAAKMAGMVTDKQEIKQVQGDTATLEAELKARLAKHLKAEGAACEASEGRVMLSH